MESPRIIFVGALVLVFEMTVLEYAKQFHLELDTRLILCRYQMFIRNGSKQFEGTNHGILFNGLILAAILGVKNHLSPLSEWLFCLAVSFTV